MVHMLMNAKKLDIGNQIPILQHSWGIRYTKGFKLKSLGENINVHVTNHVCDHYTVYLSHSMTCFIGRISFILHGFF